MNNEVGPENAPRDYVGYDLCGYPFNKKYPPNKKRYGESYEGYPNKALGVLLYDYCVMGYDVESSIKTFPLIRHSPNVGKAAYLKIKVPNKFRSAKRKAPTSECKCLIINEWSHLDNEPKWDYAEFQCLMQC